MGALAHPDLQRVLDSVLFEPSLWHPAGDRADRVPESIPAPDRQHLATACGLLFNELLTSPRGVLTSLRRLLALALELDTGRWTSRAAAVILFVVRVIVSPPSLPPVQSGHVSSIPPY